MFAMFLLCHAMFRYVFAMSWFLVICGHLVASWCGECFQAE